MIPSAPDRWRPTPALLAAATVTLGCLLLAVLLRRGDLVAIAAPFLIGTLAALLATRPDQVGVQVEVVAPVGAAWEGDSLDLTVRIEIDAHVDCAVLQVPPAEAGLDVETADARRCLRPAAGRPVDLALRATAVRWGRWLIGPVSVSLVAAHGLLRYRVPAMGTAFVPVVPLREVFDATDAVPHATGMVGGHRSPRPGDGSDLLSLRPFLPGDRLRRITWPASLRTGQLHVRTSTDDRDVDIDIVLDTWTEVGLPGHTGATSIDTSVRASASIAEHYLGRGDRVGLIDLGQPGRAVRPAAGRRHMQVIFGALLSARLRRPDPDTTTRSLGRLRARSFVIVLSTLLNDSIGHHIATLAQAGRAVLVVDTLPSDVPIPHATEWTPLAWHLALLRRDTLIEALSERGVAVARWQGAGSLDAVLRQLSAAARAARRRR